ncbi:MAG: terpene cyclase/mutase family protein [Xanthomonadales bacterium]|nr:terpene cyclase/mutase family protein [Xanthomonadales bacterium]
MKKTLIVSVLAVAFNVGARIHPIVSHNGSYVVEVTASQQVKQPMAALGLDDAIEAGAIHIAAQQCPDGGFGWPHNDCSNTYHNITAPIIDGVRQAYIRSGNAGFLGVMKDAGDYDLTNEYGNGEARFGAFTSLMMWNLSKDTGDSIYKDFTDVEFFATLDAGTYSDNDYDTQGWITAVETSRTGTWVNLRPWEFSSLVLTSQRHCRNIQSGDFELAIWRGLGTLDNTDPDNVYSDIIGVAGGLLGLARINRESFPAINAPLHAGVNGIGTLEDLADYLMSLQNPDGSFYWHSNLAAPEDGDKDTQTTAYAVMALIKAAERLDESNYLSAITLGQSYLLSMQDSFGGFASYPGDTEHNTEVEGEALTAIGMTGVYDRIYQSGMECYLY